jgi:hypothetical protein
VPSVGRSGCSPLTTTGSSVPVTAMPTPIGTVEQHERRAGDERAPDADCADEQQRALDREPRSVPPEERRRERRQHAHAQHRNRREEAGGADTSFGRQLRVPCSLETSALILVSIAASDRTRAL